MMRSPLRHNRSFPVTSSRGRFSHKSAVYTRFQTVFFNAASSTTLRKQSAAKRRRDEFVTPGGAFNRCEGKPCGCNVRPLSLRHSSITENYGAAVCLPTHSMEKPTRGVFVIVQTNRVNSEGKKERSRFHYSWHNVLMSH